jgi:mono/diheme cytochrome c family protein
VLAAAAAAILVAACAAAAVVYIVSERKLNARWPFAAVSIRVSDDAAAVERGEHLFRAVGSCTLCHGEDGGGSVYVENPSLGRVVGPNLTRGRGGLGSRFQTADWERAIRQGVHEDGRSMIVMPTEVFVNLSDEDMSALIAYLTRLPPVDRELPATRLYFVGRAMLAAGALDILVAPKTTPQYRVDDAPLGTPQHGRYLANISGCHGCHGYGLSGGRVAGPPDLPPASNLTPSGPLSSWTEADFRRLMREGRRPDGSMLHEFMPWRQFSLMSDAELASLWLYIRSVPPRTSGSR